MFLSAFDLPPKLLCCNLYLGLLDCFNRNFNVTLFIYFSIRLRFSQLPESPGHDMTVNTNPPSGLSETNALT